MTEIIDKEIVPDIQIEGCPFTNDEGFINSGVEKLEGDVSGSEEEASAQGFISDNEQLGCEEKSQENWIPPEEDLQQKIIKQVEFYFSDSNILKDAFLLKHVRRNKQGFVSLKLIASFKKVKNLTKDWQAVAYSLKKSDQLVVNEQGTKVRRKNNLPDYDETISSRTVVATNLPFETPTIENVAELFSSCGEIALVRILRPGKSIPPDIKQHLNKHPEIGTTLCALIEFEKAEHAQKAVKELDNKNDWRKMHVIELVIRKKKDKSKENQKDSGDGGDADKKRVKKKKNLRVEELSHGDYDSFNSSGSEEVGSPAQRRKTGSSPRNTPKTSPMSQRKGKYGDSPKNSPFNSPQIPRKNGEQGNTSPWVQRRLLAAQEASPLAQDKSSKASPLIQRRDIDINQQNGTSLRLVGSDGILRQPRGPDGSPGFYGGKGRGRVRSFTVSL